MDSLEGLFLRPRQVRYQAALRPDMTRIDSKALSNFVTTSIHDFRPRPCQNRAKSAHCTVTVPTDSPLAAALRLPGG